MRGPTGTGASMSSKGDSHSRKRAPLRMAARVRSTASARRPLAGRSAGRRASSVRASAPTWDVGMAASRRSRAAVLAVRAPARRARRQKDAARRLDVRMPRGHRERTLHAACTRDRAGSRRRPRSRVRGLVRWHGGEARRGRGLHVRRRRRGGGERHTLRWGHVHSVRSVAVPLLCRRHLRDSVRRGKMPGRLPVPGATAFKSDVLRPCRLRRWQRLRDGCRPANDASGPEGSTGD